jgi:uncharacterized damage-inducible protein DinB
MPPTRRAAAPPDLGAAVRSALATSERITQFLLENLPEAVWQAAPPGGEGRTVAAIVAHIHNVRLMWLKASAVELVPGRDRAGGATAAAVPGRHASGAMGTKIPAGLDKGSVKPDQARKALAQSHVAVDKLVAAALAGDGRIKNFPPDAVAFVAYLIAHEAHHRGQICSLARQIGHRLPNAVTFGMWEWNKRRQEAARA